MRNIQYFSNSIKNITSDLLNLEVKTRLLILDNQYIHLITVGNRTELRAVMQPTRENISHRTLDPR